jgi:hypothetical protein
MNKRTETAVVEIGAEAESNDPRTAQVILETLPLNSLERGILLEYYSGGKYTGEQTSKEETTGYSG